MNSTFPAYTECTSGCQSGWTSYLQNSYISSQCPSHKLLQEKRMKEEAQDEDDLSMVSDASSGPPLFHQDEYNSYRNFNDATVEEATLLTKHAKTENRRKTKRQKIRKQSTLLDDTASSSVSNDNVDIVKNEAIPRPNVLDFSQGHSTTQFQGTSTYKEQHAFFHPCLPTFTS